MHWWNEFVNWFVSPAARPALLGAFVVLVAIVVSGVISALIARGAVRGMLERTARAQKASAIAALIDAATEATVWNSLTPQEQVLSDRAVGQADIAVRMLPIRGAGIAANWASHQLAELKRSSATFGYQLDPAVAEFRDRLMEWQHSPRRARKIFQDDLERWRFSTASSEQALRADQDAWVAQQHHDRHQGESTWTPTETPTSAPAVAVAAEPVMTTDPSRLADHTDTATQHLFADVQRLSSDGTLPPASGSAEVPSPVPAVGRPSA